jgi:hypothetical protein
MLMPALAFLLGVLAFSLCGSVALRKTPSFKLTFANVVVFDVGAFGGVLACVALWNVLGDGSMDNGWFVTVFMATTPVAGIFTGLALVKCVSALIGSA